MTTGEGYTGIITIGRYGDFFMKLEKFKEKNNKKIGILIFTLCCVLLIAGVYLYSSFAIYEQNQNFNVINGTVEDPGDLYFAFYVDDVINKTMPAKGSGYTLDIEKSICTNGATPTLNEETWSIKVNNLTTTHTKCTLYFRKQTFSDAIIACSESSNAAQCFLNNSSLNEEQLAYDETTDNNLRYIGANPNNYVSFNNELWRIIGVFNNIKNVQDISESRIKLIKAEPYSTTSWGEEFDDADWSTSYLQQELNESYLPTIVNTYQQMIANVTWKSASLDIKSQTSLGFYQDEGCCESAPWLGKIGLIWPSDFGFATSGGNETSRTVCLNTSLISWGEVLSGTADCSNNDWLSNAGWTMSPNRLMIGMAYRVMDRVVSYETGQVSRVYPVLYLISSIKIIDGTGSESDPFILQQ